MPRSSSASDQTLSGSLQKTTKIKSSTKKSSRTQSSSKKSVVSKKQSPRIISPINDFTYSIQVKKPVSYNPSGKNLVIVESPSKAKTISKYLGSDYEVKASMGHIIDLPDKTLGVDMQNFVPHYEISSDKKKIVSELISIANKSKQVRLATDEDREGEAIAWHLASVMGLDLQQTPRIVFHEITKSAITHAIENPRILDFNLVYSQQTRRVLDRIVGYQISPILWKKLKPGLSAGRVQSVAVKLIVAREREINAFEPKEYRTVKAQVSYKKQNLTILCQSTGDHTKSKKTKHDHENGGSDEYKPGRLTKSQVQKIIDQLGLTTTQSSDPKSQNTVLTTKQPINFNLTKTTIKESKKSSPPPFITSTLQQVASRSLGRGVKQVMSTAQKLYENGYITYMRTDSTNLSTIALDQIKSYVTNQYGSKYSHTTQYVSKSKNAQEAHEAIRPTDIATSDTTLGTSESKLYKLIRKRTIASQMSDALYQNTVYQFVPPNADQQIRTAEGKVLQFDGWLKIYGKDEDDESQTLPSLPDGSSVASNQIQALQDFTKPPARYTEASLVKALESNGIGRPSTYATVITTIQTRGYVVKQDNKLIPTEIASKVIDHLSQYFKELMDYDFTAQMEQKLDDIAVGYAKWDKVLSDFNVGFQKDLASFNDGHRVDTTIDQLCPKCGKPLKLKFSKGGSFVGCSGYPDCDYIQQTADKQSKLDEIKGKYEGLDCPAGGKIVVKIGRFGPFLTSDQYPSIKRIKSPAQFDAEKLIGNRPVEICDKCGIGSMVVKTSRKGPFLACDQYPNCKNAKSIP